MGEGLAAQPQLGLLNCLQMVEYKRAKLRDEESPEITVEGRATRDSLEVGKGLFSSGLIFGTMPACHNHEQAVLVGHLSRFPLHLWPPAPARTIVRHFKAMTLHKTGSTCLFAPGPEVNPTSYLLRDSRNRPSPLHSFVFGEDLCHLRALPCSSIAPVLCSPGGIPEEDKTTLGFTHTAGAGLGRPHSRVGCPSLWLPRGSVGPVPQR